MKAKPVIVVIVTLVIGFLLGMLTSAQIRYHKLKPVRVYFSEEAFTKQYNPMRNKRPKSTLFSINML
jgi:hypothetical protein